MKGDRVRMANIVGVAKFSPECSDSHTVHINSFKISKDLHSGSAKPMRAHGEV